MATSSVFGVIAPSFRLAVVLKDGVVATPGVSVGVNAPGTGKRRGELLLIGASPGGRSFQSPVAPSNESTAHSLLLVSMLALSHRLVSWSRSGENGGRSEELGGEK